ncbi:MAG: PrsW family intramembrane metalloprotease [Candidatus Pacebacteria bacterium]|nr:PrsW family intramembrane metalloprotease [Candidatus Paceibacterota bacterium]
MSEFGSIAIAMGGGFLPALLWVWFWLREDRAHPEPRQLIALAFLVGMIAVAVVIPIQKTVATFIVGTTLTFMVWSFIEEVVKTALAGIVLLWRRDVDEPVDMVIYMVLVALGFAAAENALFLVSPLAGDGVVANLMTGNLRFIGATLLHTLSSAAVGVCLALSFYKPKRVRRVAAVLGVILAASLHSLFNFLILNTPSEQIFRTFALVWVGVLALLGAIEIVKRMHHR